MINNYTKYGFIFDMDGTLVDNMRFHTKAWTIMLAENGIENDGQDFLVETAGKTNREIIPLFFEDASDEEISKLASRKEALYRELYKPELKVVDGVTRFLEQSQKLGVGMAVATAAPIENMEFILDGLDLRTFFSAIITAADVKNGKPHPEGFLISAEKLGVKPLNCIVFEDAINGFEAAYRAGMKSIGISTVNSIEDILKLRGVVEAKEDFLNLDPQEIVEKYVPMKAKAK